MRLPLHRRGRISQPGVRGAEGLTKRGPSRIPGRSCHDPAGKGPPMMRRLLILGLAAAAGGCGTMANMAGREYPLMGLPTQTTEAFGGAANDLRWVRLQAGRVVAPEDLEDVPAGFVLTGYFALIDLPMSVVGDVFTLPSVLLGARAPVRETARGAEPGAAAKDADPISVQSFERQPP